MRAGARAGMLVLTVVLAVVVAAYALTILLADVLEAATATGRILYDVAFVIASVITGLHAASGGGRTRPWFLLSGGMALYVIARIALSVTGGGMEPDAATPADVLWLMFYPFGVAAILLIAKRRLSMRVANTLLDAALVGVGAFAVGVALIDASIAPGMAGADPAFVITRSMYLLGDLLILVLVLAVAQAFNWRPPTSWWFLIAAGAVFSVADAAYLVQLANGTYEPDSWVDFLWPLTALLITLGAVTDAGDAPVPRAQQRLAFLAPSVAIVAAGAVLLWQPTGPLQVTASVAATITILLAVVRLNLDVRESRRLSHQLRRSRVDMLTDLPNRRALLDLPPRPGTRCSVIVLGLDSFKDVNGSMGHDAGDRLLVMVAARLRESVYADDLVARLEGDEFAVVLWNAPAHWASTEAEVLVRALEEPLSLDGIPLLVTGCAGVVESGPEGPDLAELLRQGAAALDQAKAQGPGLVRTHTGEAGEQTAERLQLRAEARAALTAGGQDFQVHYQPIVGVTDGSLLAVEALVRWQHRGRLLQPHDFLAETVRGGLMQDLTRLVLTRSLREIHDHGLDVAVSVNVPPELMTDWVIDEVRQAIASAEVEAGRLILEITEEAIMRHPDAVATVLRELRSSGVRVLLDDFGTGWSGLSTLRDLIVDGIKIDHSFLSRLPDDPTAAAIVRSVAMLAVDLDLLMVYEGVDDTEALNDLSGIGPCYLQSYGLARPMAIDALVGWLAQRGVPD
ncbi:MAG: EAL domain-containing protein [Actinomycetota bacterium]|nr:EAL domain-containing protein [Actinomycetota bacterium]